MEEKWRRGECGRASNLLTMNQYTTGSRAAWDDFPSEWKHTKKMNMLRTYDDPYVRFRGLVLPAKASLASRT